MYAPINAVTGKPYQGKNIEILTDSAQKLGTSDPRWVTYIQALKSGWYVRKGSKGTAITYVNEVKNENDEMQKVRMLFTVFNAAQVEGIEPLK